MGFGYKLLLQQPGGIVFGAPAHLRPLATLASGAQEVMLVREVAQWGWSAAAAWLLCCRQAGTEPLRPLCSEEQGECAETVVLGSTVPMTANALIYLGPAALQFWTEAQGNVQTSPAADE